MLECSLLPRIFPDWPQAASAMLVSQMVKLRLGKVEEASHSESAMKTGGKTRPLTPDALFLLFGIVLPFVGSCSFCD